MATKDSVPWKLREGAAYETGAFSLGQLQVLASRHDVPLDRLTKFSQSIARALCLNFNPRVPEQAHAMMPKGGDDASKLLKHVAAARRQLQKAQDLLEQLHFKNLYSHTGAPNPADQQRSDLFDAAETIRRFESFVEVMQREGAVVYVGKPDGRIVRDIRREAICYAAFTLWSELGRPLIYTTDPHDSTVACCSPSSERWSLGSRSRRRSWAMPPSDMTSTALKRSKQTICKDRAVSDLNNRKNRRT